MRLYKVQFKNPIHSIEVEAENSTEALLRALQAQSPAVSREIDAGQVCFNLGAFIDRLIETEKCRGKCEIGE